MSHDWRSGALRKMTFWRTLAPGIPLFSATPGGGPLAALADLVLFP